MPLTGWKCDLDHFEAKGSYTYLTPFGCEVVGNRWEWAFGERL